MEREFNIGWAVKPAEMSMSEAENGVWQKLPAVEGSVACLNCGCGARTDLPLDREICVGFGSAGYSCDGKDLWNEGQIDWERDDNAKAPTVGDVETLALAAPDHDWRIYFYAPLYEAEYQRQGEGVWVLVNKGTGFA